MLKSPCMGLVFLNCTTREGNSKTDGRGAVEKPSDTVSSFDTALAASPEAQYFLELPLFPVKRARNLLFLDQEPRLLRGSLFTIATTGQLLTYDCILFIIHALCNSSSPECVRKMGISEDTAEAIADGPPRRRAPPERNAAAGAGREGGRGKPEPAIWYSEPKRRPNVPDFPA